MIGNSDDETNFSHKLFLTNRQVGNFCRAFAKHTSTDIKLSKTQLSKMIQSGGFISRHLGPFLRTGLPLMKSVIQPLAEGGLIPFGLAASTEDAGIHKKILGSHWIVLYVNTKTVTYFDSFGIEHIPKEIKKFINNKNIIANNFRIQGCDSVMCECFCIGFVDFMFKCNSLTDFTNLFSPDNFLKNDDIIINYFSTNL